jgi:hypothetical protein
VAGCIEDTYHLLHLWKNILFKRKLIWVMFFYAIKQ